MSNHHPLPFYETAPRAGPSTLPITQLLAQPLPQPTMAPANHLNSIPMDVPTVYSVSRHFPPQRMTESLTSLLRTPLLPICRGVLLMIGGECTAKDRPMSMYLITWTLENAYSRSTSQRDHSTSTDRHLTRRAWMRKKKDPKLYPPMALTRVGSPSDE